MLGGHINGTVHFSQTKVLRIGIHSDYGKSGIGAAEGPGQGAADQTQPGNGDFSAVHG
jgi:hypothetical protein